MRHINIPIFIPHLGCPNNCVFCNQRSISGHGDFDISSVRDEIEAVLSDTREGDECEIAFFGGSFTGIDRSLMVSLLDIAEEYVLAGRVESIRLSTRPDYIDEEILDILSRYSVRTIELGLQSMKDTVLGITKRGHSAADAEAACRLILEYGFELIGQMMIGLPSSSPEDEVYTARKICDMGAVGARVYPTVVFYDTPLCQMAQAGDYGALTTEQAAERTAEVLRIFLQNGVPCIRIGLCASEALVSDEAVFAGPNHPALGELVWNAYYYKEIRTALENAGLQGEEIVLEVEASACSKIIGQKRSNLIRLQRETATRVKKVVQRDDLRGVCVRPYHIQKKQQGEILPCI